ncbi:hypothetical protein evm_011139 [Chilo suppressalis]|nr:hypothetical protein evm_011139 [Chilo suppressalis]
MYSRSVDIISFLNSSKSLLTWLESGSFLLRFIMTSGAADSQPEAFEDLCDLLVYYTDLRSTQRVSLESKVLCALLFYAHGSYQRVTGKANHFSQEAISVYIEEVTKH